jgi:hypothetical protein
MELLLSAMSTGGLVGGANQYLCRVSYRLPKLGLVNLAPPVSADSPDWLLAGE